MLTVPIVQIGVTYEYTRFSCQQMMKHNSSFYYCDDLYVSLHGWKRIANKIHNSQKINKIIRLPFRSLWAKEALTLNVKSRLNVNEPVCFIYQGGNSFFDLGVFSYLKKHYPKAIFLYKYNDLVALNERLYPGFLDRCKKVFDLIVTYNYEDAEKYGLIKAPPVLIDYTQIVSDPDAKKSDLFFVGRAKDRLDELLRVFEMCEANGLVCDFSIIDVPQNQQRYADKISYNQTIPYLEILQRVRNTKCVLNIVQKGAKGITLRDYESIGMGKLLMTNNHFIESTDMYDSEHVIFTDQDIDFKRICNYHDSVWNCDGVKNDLNHYFGWLTETIHNYLSK